MASPNGQARLLDPDGKPYRMGYDAVEEKKRRKPPRVTLKSEDRQLEATDRKKLVATARDLARNYAIGAWMIRMHLANVAEFAFQARTGDAVLDSRLEELVRWWSRPRNFDVAARHGLLRFLRILEARRTLDGDCGVLKLSSGLVQAIEGDRIRNQVGLVDWERVVHGVVVSKAGRARGYMLHNRRQRGATFDFVRMIPARHMLWHGYFDRFDQVRGVSPVASAVNTLQDTYECLSYGVLKAKIAQLFGIVWKRDEEEAEAPGDVTSSNDTDGNLDKSETEIDFGRGPFSLDLDLSESVEVVESKQPSLEFQEFLKLLVMIGLKACDLPYSWFDKAGATWSSDRSEWTLYDRSAESKRADNRELLNQLLAWRIGLWIVDGILELPAGVAIDDLAWEWVARRMPWVDPLKEAAGWTKALEAKITSRQRICASQGADFWEIADELAAEESYLAGQGLADRPERPPASQQTAYTARLGDYRYALPS